MMNKLFFSILCALFSFACLADKETTAENYDCVSGGQEQNISFRLEVSVVNGRHETTISRHHGGCDTTPILQESFRDATPWRGMFGASKATAFILEGPQPKLINSQLEDLTPQLCANPGRNPGRIVFRDDAITSVFVRCTSELKDGYTDDSILETYHLSNGKLEFIASIQQPVSYRDFYISGNRQAYRIYGESDTVSDFYIHGGPITVLGEGIELPPSIGSALNYSRGYIEVVYPGNAEVLNEFSTYDVETPVEAKLDAFKRSIDTAFQASKPDGINVVTHSFGAIPTLLVMGQFDQSIERLTLVNPPINLSSLMQKIHSPYTERWLSFYGTEDRHERIDDINSRISHALAELCNTEILVDIIIGEQDTIVDPQDTLRTINSLGLKECGNIEIKLDPHVGH